MSKPESQSLNHSPWIAQDKIQLHRLFADNPQAALAQLDQLPQLKEMLMDLLRQSNRYADTIDRYVIAITVDLNGNIQTASKAFCDLTGYTSEDIVGQSYLILRHPQQRASIYQNMWRTLIKGNSWHGELLGLSKDGKDFWLEVNIDPIVDTHGDTIGYIAILQDITQRKRIEQMSITDDLTGAYNRRYFNQLFPQEIRRSKREGNWLAFMMCDADHFKKYNDTYGHHAGDEVLTHVVEVLHQVFHRGSDFVFRLGGEEFGVLFTLNTPKHIDILADKVLTTMHNKRIEHSGNPPYHYVTLSLGIMLLDPSLDYITEEIYKYADEALYRAKEKGRNRYEIVDVNSAPDAEFF